ncbi:MAG: coproporphyrinogen III oxidase [Muricauda sp.]|nr:radical SAM family heme chaperone HemW [Allomuricauda sp.]MAU26338.1 coproporphyrinogen III oxidase [Allomuricauda sp.]MBC31768.1 coproporphyrinogen III oxidase [Allomuricauda sp.]MBC32216.1 coproporphyrinogen III oxidase [Allomuricauda sp.]|tara:strand:+ start:37422 stop:38555 length:1134 start_codon:yes stop_codon:yes gene_type:complete
MSGIYIHIPFCKQACHYCDFHFSTSLKKKEAMVECLTKEIELRKHEMNGEVIKTIYFGGGTPSVLTIDELRFLIDAVYENFNVSDSAEITLEANPDDLSRNRIFQLSHSPVNRLSIGVQSFFEEDLKLMNRAHDSREAEDCIREAKKYFGNISIDLIYGIPGMDNHRWKANIEKALSFGIPHISSYALTVEPRTALKKFIEKGIVEDVDDEQAQEQFQMLLWMLEENGFVNYEISNFGKPGFFSENNTAYWQGKKYVGIGPSAHSFDGQKRGWNIRNNHKYIEALEMGKLTIEYETLSTTDRYNEYVMTGLRTIWGVSLKKVENDFGQNYRQYLEQQAQKYVGKHLLFLDGDILLATKKGKFLVDGIASDLFMLNLK